MADCDETESTSEPAFEADLDAVESATLQQIVATAIALNPERRAWRQDILISAVVEMLVTADMTTDVLVMSLNRVWHTSSATRPAVERALSDAQAAGLVVFVDDLSGVARWQATPTAKDESRQDREWGEVLHDRFHAQVGKRLTELESSMSDEKHEKLVNHLIRALAEGAANTYAVTTDAGSFLRPVSFNNSAVMKYLDDVEPRTAREILSDLAVAAMDPDDEFGTEVVHLLVVGNLLHGMLTRRDVSAAPSFAGTRILLDTSVLLGLIADGTPEERLVEDLIRTSASLGVEVIVAGHTADEWDRVWDAAERQRPQEVDTKSVTRFANRLADNPFIAEFLRRKAVTSGLTWIRYSLTVQDPRRLLRSLPVSVRPAGNNTEQDKRLFSDSKKLLVEMSRDPATSARRTNSAAEADAASLAMVARWRRDGMNGRCCAYFLANERLTGEAYKQLVPGDTDPLIVSGPGWLMYMAAVTTDDPLQRAKLADLVGTAVVRQSFFGLATSYTLDEALKLSEMLAEDGDLAVEDVRAVMQLDLHELVGETNAEDPGRVLAAGGAVLRRRSQRRDERAKRTSARAEYEIADARQRADTSSSETDGLRRQIEELKGEKDRLAAERDVHVDRLTRWRRIAVVWTLAVVVGGLLGYLVLNEIIVGKARLVAYVLAVVYAGESLRFCRQVETPWWELLVAAATTLGWTVVGSLIS